SSSGAGDAQQGEGTQAGGQNAATSGTGDTQGAEGAPAGGQEASSSGTDDTQRAEGPQGGEQNAPPPGMGDTQQGEDAQAGAQNAPSSGADDAQQADSAQASGSAGESGPPSTESSAEHLSAGEPPPVVETYRTADSNAAPTGDTPQAEASGQPPEASPSEAAEEHSPPASAEEAPPDASSPPPAPASQPDAGPTVSQPAQLQARLEEFNLEQAYADAKKVFSGEIPLEQLSAEQRANIEKAVALANDTDPSLLDRQVETRQALVADTQDTIAQLDKLNEYEIPGLNMRVSNFKMAQMWGGAALLGHLGQAAAEMGIASKNPFAAGLGTTFNTAREATQAVLDYQESGEKLFSSLSNYVGGADNMSPPGISSIRSSPGSPSAGIGGEALRPLGSQASDSSDEPGDKVVGQGLEHAANMTDATVKLGKAPEELHDAYKAIKAKIFDSDTPPSRADKIVAGTKALDEGNKLRESLAAGDTRAAVGHAVKVTAFAAVSAGAPTSMSDRAVHLSELINTPSAPVETDIGTQAQYYVTKFGHTVGIVDPHAGNAVVSISDAFGVGRDLQEVSILEDQQHRATQQMLQRAQADLIAKQRLQLIMNLLRNPRRTSVPMGTIR
ncbi:hypothetical protein, partial [Rhizobium ruizarguesonis]|uniref:hypothetical protein n=1 Tax=Rhizobium ruizarguesonis TaxID=2081791 RepID=UPI0013DF9F28|nr:hypothetical protein [Rhizobium ruizarguesonis]